MAKKILSPGQKKRRTISIVMVVLTLVAAAVVAVIPTAAEKEARQLEQQHASATATVNAVTDEVSEYRGRKGRKITEHEYSTDYQFTLDGEQVDGHTIISASEYEALNEGDSLEVWFPEGQPELAMPKMVADRLAVSTPVDRVRPYVSWILMIAGAITGVLMLLFGREPKGVLPEGFYSENGWLDVDDKYLVYLTDSHLYSVSIDKKQVGTMQKLYQSGASIDQLLANAGDKYVGIPLSAITEVESHFHKDTIDVTYQIEGKSDSESLEFLNPAVKRHAAERIAKALPGNLNREDVQKTRLQSAMPALVVTALLAAAIFFVDNRLVDFGAILLLLLSVKVLLTRLFKPVALTRWLLPVETKAAELVN